MITQRDEFIPGTVWTPELVRQARERMSKMLASREMQQAMEDAADAEAVAPPIPAATAPIEASRIIYRRAREDDVPVMTELMLAEKLPPLFIDEWLPGFVAVEHAGELIGCGGAEIYDGACVIRSIVVRAGARHLGIARTITHLLIDDARAHGAEDAYLFTVEAYPFWFRLGFVDVPLEEWKMPPREGWQYQFVSEHPGAVAGIHSMWKRISD